MGNDETLMQHTLHFADSLKDLRNLREQLYSAADYFESSYGKDNHQQFMIDSSKDYVAKALVNTVDHLGSVADQLSKFLDEKANQFSATNIKFSCIQQRLSTVQGFVDLRGVSQHSLVLQAPNYNKHYLVPAAESSPIAKSKEIYRNSVSFPQYELHQPKQDNPFAKAFHAARTKPQPPLLRKGQSKVSSRELSPNPVNFSFTRVVSNKEAGKRSISPLSFPLKRSGSVARSVSPSPSNSKQRSPSEPRRAISTHNKHEMIPNREREIESYAKRSKHLFKALLSVHRPRKENHTVQMI